MKFNIQRAKANAFTLIEMIVVITIIGILAGLIIGVYPYAHEKKIRGRVNVELKAMETAIEGYKEKKGFYPPISPKGSARAPLYYELTASPIPDSATNYLGVTKIVNDGEDQHNFYPNVRPSQIAQVNPADGKTLPPDAAPKTGVELLGVRTRAADDGLFAIWNYNSQSPEHNHESFDLWVDVKIGSKVHRIGNWND